MKRQLEEEIRAQLMANQEMLTQNTQSWEEQVKMSYRLFVSIKRTGA